MKNILTRDHTSSTAPDESTPLLHQFSAGSVGSLQLVTREELREMREALLERTLPGDFEAKLCRLAKETLLHQFVEQNCRLFAALIQSAQQGSFRDAELADRERLLRVLAYVRKDEDAIPDYKANGFMDDLREVRAATNDLQKMLQDFKEWRLRHQVPNLWPDTLE
jgi:hypothetical protein